MQTLKLCTFRKACKENLKACKDKITLFVKHNSISDAITKDSQDAL